MRLMVKETGLSLDRWRRQLHLVIALRELAGVDSKDSRGPGVRIHDGSPRDVQKSSGRRHRVTLQIGF